jgi:two-component system, NarL family, invasion response regulator UvrY
VALAASVIAVDDRPAFLDVVRKIVQATPGLVMVGEATCGEQAVELVEQMRPDLVVMDVRMPGIGGVGATRKIKAAHPSTIVALISTCSPEELPAETEGSSADAVICKRDLRPAVLQELCQRHRASAN